MKPEFQNIDVECWEHKGRLGISGPQICLFHSKREHGHVMIQAIDELQSEAPAARRTIGFAPSGRKAEITAVRLRLVPSTDDLKVVCITREKTTATFEMTENGLQALRRGLEAWCDGTEDFCVSPCNSNLKQKELGDKDKASGELWFWGPTMEP